MAGSRHWASSVRLLIYVRQAIAEVGAASRSQPTASCCVCFSPDDLKQKWHSRPMALIIRPRGQREAKKRRRRKLIRVCAARSTFVSARTKQKLQLS